MEKTEELCEFCKLAYLVSESWDINEKYCPLCFKRPVQKSWIRSGGELLGEPDPEEEEDPWEQGWCGLLGIHEPGVN